MGIVDRGVFLKESLNRLKEVGSIAPSSRALAREMIRPLLVEGRGPQKILEVGAGTGPITLEIIKNGVPGDSLDVCELNPKFIDVIKSRVAKLEGSAAQRMRINYLNCPVETLKTTVKYDQIICALPFSNFDLALCKTVINKLTALSHESTDFVFIEYIGGRRLKSVMGAEEVRKIDQYFRILEEQHPTTVRKIIANIPPTKVIRMQLAAHRV